MCRAAAFILHSGPRRRSGWVASLVRDRLDDERDTLVAHAGPDAAGTFERDKPVKGRPEGFRHDFRIGAKRGYRCRQGFKTGS